MKRKHFSVPTKLCSLLCVIVGTSLTTNTFLTWVLVAMAFVYILVQRNIKLFISMGIFYTILIFLLYLIKFHDFRVPIFSEFHLLMFWTLSSVFIVSWDLITTPSGEVSAFLAKAHAPTSVILGVLVTFRFFPTMKSEIKCVWRSMKNRGLTSVENMLFHPAATCEYVFVPMLLRSLQIADQLSVSAVARGVENPTVRGSYYKVKIGVSDYIFMAVWLTVTIIFLAIGGIRL